MINDFDDNIRSRSYAETIFKWSKLQAEKFWFCIDYNHSILELGSWNGIYLDYLQELWFFNTQWIDARPRYYDAFPDLNITKWIIWNMSFDSQIFDILTSISIFDKGIYKEQDRNKMLQDIHRVLKPSGLYIAYENRESSEIKTILENMWHRANTIIIGMSNNVFVPAKN